MKVSLNPWQKEVQQDKHRFRVICAGRRSGKSVLSRMIVLKWATENPGDYWIVSPNYKQSEMIHWKELQREVPREWVTKKNEVKLSLTINNGSTIQLKGAENPDSLRGVKLRGLVIDEIASIRNWGWLWSECLRPTLTDYAAPAIFISTPKGYNHFYDLYNQGQEKESVYKSWRFTSYDNPFIPKEEIDQAKKELTEDTFAQEYLADFRKYTGLVYKDFDREKHVIEPFEIPDTWQIYRAIDFGSTNPTSCLWIAVDGDDNIYIVDEYYATKQTIDTHAGAINANPFSKVITATYGDPSGGQWIDEFTQRGIHITKANKTIGTDAKTWVRFGIEKVAERMKLVPGKIVGYVKREVQDVKGEPSIFIFNSCADTIREFEAYRWKEKSVTQAQDLNEPDVPEKANDHSMDALRYFAVSYIKQEKYIEPLTATSNKQWRIGA